MTSPFIVINNVRKLFSEFYNSCKIAGSYISSITSDNDVVLISRRTSFEQIEAFIGCILYNRIPIIIPHPSTKVFHNEFIDKMNKIEQVVHPKLCIIDLQDLELYQNFWPTIHDIPYTCDVKPPIKTCDVKKTAFMQLSSGTTGLPKVIEISHEAALANSEEYAARIKLAPNDVIVSWLPLYHDMGLIACFIMPLLCGISFVHISPFDWLSQPQSLFDNIETYGGTHVWMPNFAFSYVAKRCKNNVKNLASMKAWISCSEMTHQQDMVLFYNVFKNVGVTEQSLQVCYAMAENVFAVSHSDAIVADGNGVVSCGDLIPGTSVIIKDGYNLVTSLCKPGDIFIRSAYMAKGLIFDKYGYYNTGDIGYIKNNELYVIGRSDDMITSYGKNIFPYTIEQFISNIVGIIPGRVACFGVYSPNVGTQLVYLVAETDLEDIVDLELNIHETVLKRFDVSVKCIVVPRGYIIKTSSGKISRKRTRNKILKG
jgi:acyl-CoA synthetase (AMP-forming)/AMP-acid ligase II